MKFIVAVDLEGLACVVGAPGKSLNESPNFELAKLQGTREANAAARALFDCGCVQRSWSTLASASLARVITKKPVS